jgi:hypothetical protein
MNAKQPGKGRKLLVSQTLNHKRQGTNLSMAWAVTWRMVGYGAILGMVCGAVYGPISMLILYSVEIWNGRYTISDFPIGNAIIYCTAAVFGGAVYGGIFGFIGGIISGVILTFGLLLRRGHFLGASLYRNVIVGLCAVSVGILVLLPMSGATTGPGWFFNGPPGGVASATLALAIIPAIISAIAAWWATMRVVSWWEKSEHLVQAAS